MLVLYPNRWNVFSFLQRQKSHQIKNGRSEVETLTSVSWKRLSKFCKVTWLDFWILEMDWTKIAASTEIANSLTMMSFTTSPSNRSLQSKMTGFTIKTHDACEKYGLVSIFRSQVLKELLDQQIVPVITPSGRKFVGTFCEKDHIFAHDVHIETSKHATILYIDPNVTDHLVEFSEIYSHILNIQVCCTLWHVFLTFLLSEGPIQHPHTEPGVGHRKEGNGKDVQLIYILYNSNILHTPSHDRRRIII